MNTSEALNKAADHIEQHGWWSHHHGGTGNCASNAIRRVAGNFHPAQRALVGYLGVVVTA
jgi:hypothetical protein